MTNYLVKTTFGSFRFCADLTRAAAPIYSLPDKGAPEDEGFSTPYQTADARHREWDAARLLLEYFGRDYWCDPDCMAIDEDGNETFNGLSQDDYLDSLIVSVETEPLPASIKVNGEGGTMWSVVVVMNDGEEIWCQNYLDCGQIDNDGLQIDDDYLAHQALEFARSSRECRELEIPDNIEVVL